MVATGDLLCFKLPRYGRIHTALWKVAKSFAYWPKLRGENDLLVRILILRRMPGKSLGSNVTPAIKSVAASWPQEAYCPPRPFSFRRSYLVFMHPNHAFVRTRIRSAGLLRNLRPNIVRDIPNALLSISCLRLTSTVTSALTKNASRRNRDLCSRWPCVLWSNSFRVG